jgi:hypothetical protein
MVHLNAHGSVGTGANCTLYNFSSPVLEVNAYYQPSLVLALTVKTNSTVVFMGFKQGQSMNSSSAVLYNATGASKLRGFASMSDFAIYSLQGVWLNSTCSWIQQNPPYGR